MPFHHCNEILYRVQGAVQYSILHSCKTKCSFVYISVQCQGKLQSNRRQCICFAVGCFAVGISATNFKRLNTTLPNPSMHCYLYPTLPPIITNANCDDDDAMFHLYPTQRPFFREELQNIRDKSLQMFCRSAVK